MMRRLQFRVIVEYSHFDILNRRFLGFDNLYMKLRFANVIGDGNTISSDGLIKRRLL